MTLAWFNHPRLEKARTVLYAATDRLAFVVESFAIASAVFWLLTWAACSFDWQTVTHEWGSFWTHYAKATAEARAPVEHFIGWTLAIMTALTAAIRFPKARLCWAPWPNRATAAASHESFA